MPDGKLDGLASDDDDPFEGVEIAADAPEPTQEEMDEWATLDTPDEGGSPLSTSQEAKPEVQAATASVPPVTAAPAPEVPDDTEACGKKEELESESVSAPTNAMPSEPPKHEANRSTAAGPSYTAAMAAPATSAVASTTVGLSEIAPAYSPEPSRSGAGSQHGQRGHTTENPLNLRGDGNGEDEEEPLHPRQQRPQQSGGGWGGGWSAGWGLGALGGKLREVAAGAVRDVKELSESFQAALADVTGAEDEVEQARLLSAMDRAAESQSQGHQASVDSSAQYPGGADAEDAAAGGLPTAAPRQVTEPARETLTHGAGASRPAVHSAGGSFPAVAGGDAAAGDGGPPADPALEAGLQAIDAQVEQLATGAARAISSLWGGLSSVAKVVAAEVAASVADVQSSEAVRGVAQIGSKLAHTAERGLETVGRTAMVLLEEVAGVGGGLPGRRRIWGDEADARAADMGREPSSFQDFFYIYGGEQLAEEVNNLANECSHLCNRSRSKLEGDQQQALDEALARLGPYFNDPWVSASASPPAAAAEAPALGEGSREAAERLGHMYDPIGYLCQDSQARGEAYLHQLVDAVEAARQEQRQGLGKAAAGKKRTTGSRKAGSADRGSEERQALLAEDRAAEADAAEDSAAAAGNEAGGEEAEWQHLAVDPAQLLESFRAHFTKRMAEVATAQLQLLLSLGASVAAPARTGRPAVDGISWPDSSEQQAALLAVEAQRMVADLATIADAYRATITAVRQHLQKTPAAAAVATPGDEATPEDAEHAPADGAEAPAASAGKEDVVAAVAGEVVEDTVVHQAVLDELEAALEVASKSATASIKSGYRGLLYAVLLRSLVTQIAQQREEDEKEQEAEAAAASEATKESATGQNKEEQPEAKDGEEQPEEKDEEEQKPLIDLSEAGGTAAEGWPGKPAGAQ